MVATQIVIVFEREVADSVVDFLRDQAAAVGLLVGVEPVVTSCNIEVEEIPDEHGED